MPKNMLTAVEIGEKFGISRRRVLQLALARDVPGTLIGNTLVWDRDQVKALKPGRAGRPQSTRKGTR